MMDYAANKPRMARLVPIIASSLVIGFVSISSLWALESSKKAHSPKSEESDITRIERKLDEIIATQQTILSKFDAVMEQLRIIKVRSTRH